MVPTPLQPGDELDAVVTTVAPFGVFVVTDAGVPGLVHGARDEVGTVLRLQVLAYDGEQLRSSAAPARRS